MLLMPALPVLLLILAVTSDSSEQEMPPHIREFLDLAKGFRETLAESGGECEDRVIDQAELTALLDFTDSDIECAEKMDRGCYMNSDRRKGRWAIAQGKEKFSELETFTSCLQPSQPYFHLFSPASAYFDSFIIPSPTS